MSKRIDHEYTDQIVCPYCGHKQSDSCEWMSEKGEGSPLENECDKCERPFRYWHSVSIYWSTEKLTEEGTCDR